MKSGNNHAHKISDSDTKIIESIVITLAITCYEYIENHDKHSAENLAKDYSRLGSSKSSKLAFTSLISNIYNVDYTKGHFPDEMNRQIARHLLKQNINYMRLPNLSKLLKKLETYGIFYRIEGKENIKAKSTESLPSRQKGKRDKDVRAII